MLKRKLNPSTLHRPFAAYSHGLVMPTKGRLLVSSGQLGIGTDEIIPDDVEAQCVLCFENLKAILADGGMDFSHVIRFSAFVTDRSYFPVYGAVRSRYVQGDAFTSTLLIVSGFTRAEFKVEVEITALSPE